MNEMYWITRLDTVCIISFIFFIASAFGFLYAIILYGIEADIHGKESDEAESAKKWLKPLFTILLISLPFVLFVPSEKDMYKIIGIGGTYDFLKQNETAKKLPDKVINALDKLIEQQNQKLTKEKETNSAVPNKTK